MRRVAHVLIVLVVFGALGGVLYSYQQDSLLTCPGFRAVKVYGPPAAVQLREDSTATVLIVGDVYGPCDQRRETAQSRDHAQLAAVGALAFLMTGWLVLRRRASSV
jgi:hypothetical protein